MVGKIRFYNLYFWVWGCRLKKFSFFLSHVFIVVFVSVFPVQPVQADIYQYIDRDGIIHFTNIPSSVKYRLFFRENKGNSESSRLPDRYDHLLREASERYGVSFPLLKALIKVESNFNPKAVSRAGALGLMQIMPDNIREFNINDPFDPRENIMGGARYLKKMLQRFNGELALALAAYNAGPSTVERFRTIPPIKETENYVKKVLKNYYLFKKLL